MLAKRSAERCASEPRTDIALLVSALFFQRFSLPFQHTYLMLDVVPVAIILVHQFLSGKLLVQFDRLAWFLAAAAAATFSLLLNFKSTMLTSYLLFLALYSLALLNRRSTPEQYKTTLRAFQSLVAVLSYLAVGQFAAQFVIDGRRLIMFYGMVPDILLGEFYAGGANTIHTIEGLGSLLKSNGIFLAEASNLSQVTALGILIEVMEFRRARYLIIMAFGFLTAYSGVGMMVLLLFLPLAALRDRRASLSVLFVIVAAIGVCAIGLIDLSVFFNRAGEFENTRASGFARFVSPFWLLSIHFDTASLQAFLVGNGPGTSKTFYVSNWWAANPLGWFKWLYEYGIIGSFLFVLFCASCLRRSRCPALLLAALMFVEVLAAGFLTTWFLTLVITLCTLQSAEPQGTRVAAASRHPGPPTALLAR